ncbi:hypothetical protein [Agrobacterium vitis]|uniref:hypothetical protein n=1 Tax=Agrobacterium vitis TaxID=373 RepID=UPI0015DAB6CF|nr:hypothetical protein [Agrobacterium vitis]
MAKSFLSRLLSSLRFFPRSEPLDVSKRVEPSLVEPVPAPPNAKETAMRMRERDVQVIEIERQRRRALAEKNMSPAMADRTQSAVRMAPRGMHSDVLREHHMDSPSTQNLLVSLTAYSLTESSPSGPSCSDSSSYSSDTSSYSSSDSGSSSFDSGSCASD